MNAYLAATLLLGLCGLAGAQVAQEIKPRAKLATIPAAVAFTKDGKTLLSAGASLVSSWDYPELKPLTSEKTEWVDKAAFTPDGKLAALTKGSNAVRLWDMVARKQLHSLPQPAADRLAGLALSPDGKTLALGTARGGELGTTSGPGAELRLYDVSTGKLKETVVKNLTGAVWAVAYSPDGSLLAHGGGWAGFGPVGAGGHLKLWDVATKKEARHMKHDGAVMSLAFSADGKTIASGTYEVVAKAHVGVVKLWKVENGELLRTIKGYKGEIYAVALSPDGKLVVWAGYDSIVKVSDTSSGKEINVLKLTESDSVRSLAFSPDGNTLAVASAGGFHLWDVAAIKGEKKGQ
jgi:WD40 repeat protein